MANQIIIDIGAVANDGTGDPLRTAFGYVNDNFSNVWATGVANANIGFSGNKILTVNTNGNLVLAPNGTGKVVANVDIVPNTANVRNLGALTNRWSTVYSQYLNVSGDTTFTGDLTVEGNLTVEGDTIQIGNITTDTKTIQLANSASTANAANGSGVTVGANDDIATMLYSSTSNTWVMNIGANITGNVTAPYFIGNGSQLTGITSYSNTNATSLLASFGSNTISTTGNITAGYFIGNGSQLTGVTSYANANAVAYGQAGWAGNIIPATSNVYSLGNATNQWSDLYVSNATIYMNNVPISLTAGNVLTVDGEDVVVTTANGTVNLGNLTVNDYNIYNAAGQGVIISNFSFVEEAETAYVQIPAGNSTADLNVVQEQGNVRLVANAAVWNFGTDGILTTPGLKLNNSIIELNPDSAATQVEISPNGESWAFLQIPNNATGNVANVRLHNDAGNIEIAAGDTSHGGSTHYWYFGADGNLSVPVNINFNGGGIQQVLNEDFYVRVSDDEDEGWSIYNVVDDGAGTALTRTRIDSDGFYVQTDMAGSNYQWNFNGYQGITNFPGNLQGTYGGDTSFYAYDNGSGGMVEMKTISYIGDQLLANVTVRHPNVTISTQNSVYTWTFDGYGNLILPPSGNIVGDTANNNGHLSWFGNSSGDGNGYTTMRLVPDDTLEGNDQYLIIDPTAPGHIHIRAGGTQDNSGAELILGGENSHFRVDNGSNPNVYIKANNYNWTFGTDGNITLPGNSTVGVPAAVGGARGYSIDIRAGAADQGDYYTTPGGDVNITGGLGATNDGGGGGHGGNVNITAGLSADPAGVAGNVTIGSGTNYWQFNNNGNLQVPGSINGDNNGPLIIDGNGSGIEGYISLPASNFGGEQIAIVNEFTLGNGISLVTNGGEWHFGNSGAFTAPGNITTTANISGGYILGNAAFMTGIPASYGNANVADFLDSLGSNAIVTTGNISGGNLLASGYANITGNINGSGATFSGNVTAANFSGNISITGNVTGTSSNVTLVAGSYSTTFDNTGNTTLANGTVTMTNLVANGTTSLGNTSTITTANYQIGYRDIPQITFSANATAALTDAGKHYYSTTAGNLALTLPDNSNVAFPTGTAMTIVVQAAGNVLVNAGTGVTLYMGGSSTSGNRVVGAYGMATVMKVAANVWFINGTGVY